MAYAELAGPARRSPASTPRSPASSGYAVFGPSRVLVLGPDSSVSPLIFAAITPLLVADDPGKRDRAGRDAGPARRPHRDRPRARQARVRRRPAVERGAGRLHERPRDHDHRRPAAEAVRLLHRRRRLRRRAARVRSSTSTPRKGAALAVGARRARRAARAAALHAARSRRCSSRSSAPRRVGGRSTSPARVATVGTLPAGLPDAVAAVDVVQRRRPACSLAAIGITLVSLTDTIATASSFAARRGDEVQPNQEMIGIGAANVAAGFFQGFAVSTSGSRTAVAEQSGAKTQLTGRRRRRAGRGAAAVLQLAARGPAAVGARRRRHRRRALARRTSPRSASTAQVRKSSFAPVARGDARRRRARRARGHRRRDLPRGAAVLPAQLVAARRGARPHRRQRGLAQPRRPPRRARGAGHRGVPLGGAAVLRQRRHVPPADPPAREASASRAGSCCSARPSPTSTSPPPRCSSSSTTSSTPTGIHLAFVEMRSRLQDLVGRYGLYDTLDRDHFYATIDAALAAIRAEDGGTDPGERAVTRSA